MSTARNLINAVSRWYRRLFQQRMDERTRAIVDVLRTVPVFAHLSSRALYAMAEALHRRSYRRGETLYYEGDPGLGLYILEKGRIQLKTESEPGITRELRQIGRDEVFGVLSVLGDFRRLETAQTLSEVRVLGFFRPDLKNVMKRNPKAGAEISMALARYVGAQHVSLIRLMADRDGRDVALHSYAEAAQVTPEEAMIE